MIKSGKPLNNTLYTYTTGPEPDKIFIITIPILFYDTYTPQHPRPLPKTSNIPIFQTIDNITFQWLFIDGANTSNTI